MIIVSHAPILSRGKIVTIGEEVKIVKNSHMVAAAQGEFLNWTTEKSEKTEKGRLPIGYRIS